MGTRIDLRLVELGLAESREKARGLVMAGLVLADGKCVEKPSVSVVQEQEITLKAGLPFVSRGGLKLDKAIAKYGLQLAGLTAVDVGASTGGFTDCMLKAGAKRVYSVDVGYGQLAWELRNDQRVVVLERHNARNMKPGWFNEVLDFAAMDVAFISIKLILPALYSCLREGAMVVALVKPQFEAGREKVGKHGVVRSPQTHKQVLVDCAEFAAGLGFGIYALDYSPITGPKGNIEFLMLLEKCGKGRCADIQSQACRVVAEAHEELA